MNTIPLILLVLASNGDRPLDSKFPVQEISTEIRGERLNGVKSEADQVVVALHLAQRCSAMEATWIREGKERIRLSEEYFPQRSRHVWALHDLVSGWFLELEEFVPGLEFDSVGAARPGEVVSRALEMSEASQAVESKVSIRDRGAEPLAVSLDGEDWVAELLAAAEPSGHLERWRRNASSTLTADLRAMRSLLCVDDESCPFERVYALMEAILGGSSPGSTSPEVLWDRIERHSSRGLSGAASRVTMPPLATTACRQESASDSDSIARPGPQASRPPSP